MGLGRDRTFGRRVLQAEGVRVALGAALMGLFVSLALACSPAPP